MILNVLDLATHHLADVTDDRRFRCGDPRAIRTTQSVRGTAAEVAAIESTTQVPPTVSALEQQPLSNTLSSAPPLAERSG